VEQKVIAVVLIAGGRGTRSIDPTTPKSLHKVDGTSLIEHQLRHIDNFAPAKVKVVGHFGGERLHNEIKILAEKYPGLEITYIHESEARGTLHALKEACKLSVEDYEVTVMGDLFFTFDISALIQYSKENYADIVTVVHPNNHPHDSDLLVVDDQGFEVRNFLSKRRQSKSSDGNMAVAGVYCVRTEWINQCPLQAGDISQDLIPYGINTGARSFGFLTADFIMDSGTPERILRIEANLRSGVIKRRTGANKRAAFIDLDDTLIPNIENKRDVSALNLDPGIIKSLKRLNDSGIPTIVCSNQPGIAKGLFTISEFARFQREVDGRLAEKKAFLDAWYFCPHHPEGGWLNEVPELKIDCGCRKPKAGMLIRASAELGVDLKSSWFIGDSGRDEEAASRVGVSFIRAHVSIEGPGCELTMNALDRIGDQFANH